MKEVKLGSSISLREENSKDLGESFHLLRYGQLPEGLSTPSNRSSAKLSKSKNDNEIVISFGKVCLVLRY